MYSQRENIFNDKVRQRERLKTSYVRNYSSQVEKQTMCKSLYSLSTLSATNTYIQNYVKHCSRYILRVVLLARGEPFGSSTHFRLQILDEHPPPGRSVNRTRRRPQGLDEPGRARLFRNTSVQSPQLPAGRPARRGFRGFVVQGSLITAPLAPCLGFVLPVMLSRVFLSLNIEVNDVFS